MIDGNGTPYVPDYSWRRPDGSWGWKYINLPNGVYLIADELGNYTAPPYAYSGADPTFYEITGWRRTNLYRPHLYVNGILCNLIKGSQYDSGAGFPRNGGASYFAAAYDLTVILSWSWDAQSGFRGFVTGKYGQSSSFRGNWDGLANFSALTGGAIVSLTPLPNGPAAGPPQVAINGSALVFNSSMSSSGADVYLGGLGQTLTINADGSVVYTRTNGTQVTTVNGIYDPNTHQFIFDGNALTGVAATDTAGHNLNTLGSVNPDGTTTLAGSLDVEGSHLTLGAWDAANGNSIYGLVMSYTDATGGAPSVLGLSTTRVAANWLWAHPSTDGGSDQIISMQLDYSHRVSLFDPGNPGSANVVLDPGGGSGFHGAVRIQPQGDIPMGDFHSGPTPP